LNDRELYIAAAIGDEADKFFQSDLGQYVLQKSLQEVAENQKRFAEATISELRGTNIAEETHANINIARKALLWMNTALQEGRKSLALLDVEQTGTPE